MSLLARATKLLDVASKNTKQPSKKEAARLKKLRLSMGMSTRAFGKLFGKSNATICQWENCNTDIPEIALKLLDIFEKEHQEKHKHAPGD